MVKVKEHLLYVDDEEEKDAWIVLVDDRRLKTDKGKAVWTTKGGASNALRLQVGDASLKAFWAEENNLPTKWRWARDRRNEWMRDEYSSWKSKHATICKLGDLQKIKLKKQEDLKKEKEEQEKFLKLGRFTTTLD